MIEHVQESAVCVLKGLIWLLNRVHTTKSLAVLLNGAGGMALPSI